MSKIIDKKLFLITKIAGLIFLINMSAYTFFGNKVGSDLFWNIFWFGNVWAGFISLCQLIRYLVLDRRVKRLYNGISIFCLWTYGCQISDKLGYYIDEYAWGFFVIIFIISLLIYIDYGRKYERFERRS